MQKIMNFVRHKLIVMAVVMVGVVGCMDGAGAASGSATIPPGTPTLKVCAMSTCSPTKTMSAPNPGCAQTTETVVKCGNTCVTAQECATCPTGYDNSGRYSVDVDGATLVLATCVSSAPVAPCSCGDYLYWPMFKEFGTDGYMRKVDPECVTKADGTCDWDYSEYEYQCASGYYGTARCSSSSCSGCTRCPAHDGSYGTVGAGNGNDIEDCYIAAETILEDASGNKYKSPNKCMYKE